jgi:carbon-monoxide dehydrogenase medium subunit
VAAAEQALVGAPLDAERLAAAAAATRDSVQGYDDVRGPAAFRRGVAGALVERAIRRAAERAGIPLSEAPTTGRAG